MNRHLVHLEYILKMSHLDHMGEVAEEAVGVAEAEVVVEDQYTQHPLHYDLMYTDRPHFSFLFHIHPLYPHIL